MMVRSQLILIMLMSFLEIERAVGVTLAARLVHRFSDEVKAIRVSRGENVTLPERRSLRYYRMLAGNDVKRQNTRQKPQYETVFPSEGSKTMSLGNDFGWCSLVYGASIMQDRNLNEYKPSSSSTSKQLPCSHRLCESVSSCKSPGEQCPYTVNYYAENTSSSGLLVEDILHLVGDDDGSNTSVHTPVIIGCGMRQNGDYLDGIAPDGLMGLGLGEISVPSYLAKTGLVRNSFSLCFDGDGSGTILFGDVGPANQQSTSFLPLKGKYTTYIVGAKAFCIQNSCFTQTSFRLLIDSGSSFTYLPNKVYEMMTKEFDRHVNATRTSFKEASWEYCYKPSANELPKVPSLKFVFQQDDSFVVHSPIFVISGREGVAGFCLAIQPQDGDIGTIGQNFMTGYRLVFDRENLKLGWSQSDCQYLSAGKRMPLTPGGAPTNPLPTNDQQSAPSRHAVSPAIAGRAPSKSSATPPDLLSSQLLLRWPVLLLLLLPLHALIQL